MSQVEVEGPLVEFVNLGDKKLENLANIFCEIEAWGGHQKVINDP